MRMIDLCAGRLGWAKAFHARGWKVTAVDLVRPPEVPEGIDFYQTDIMTLNWRWVMANFDFGCASTPCENFSLFTMSMFHPDPPYPEMGIQLFMKAQDLFRGIPHVMENVRGAEQFMGIAVDHCGPFYLWGNSVPPILPQGIKKGIKLAGSGFRSISAEDRKRIRKSDPMMSTGSKSKARKEHTANAAMIPPELANCVAEYAERIIEQKKSVAG